MTPATKATMDGIRSTTELRQLLEAIGPDAQRIDALITEETARSNSRVRFLQVLQEASEAAVESSGAEAGPPVRAPAPAPDSGRNLPEGDLAERVQEFVVAALDEEPDADVASLFQHAEAIAPKLMAKLSLRQFNARYVLPVKRDRNPRPKKASRKPQQRHAEDVPAPPQVVLLHTDHLEPWPGLNPRRHFDPVELQELADSLQTDGVRQPLLVYEGKTKYWIVAGERRWRAAQLREIQRLPCLVSEYTLLEALRISGIENIQRSQLSQIEEARWCQRMLDEGELSQRELAAEIGRSQGWVANRVRVLQLPARILSMIEAGKLPYHVARDLILPFASLTDEKLWGRLAEEIADRLESQQKELSEHLVREVVRDVAAKASHPLRYADHTTSRIWGLDGTGGERDDPTAESHQKCGCGAPKWGWRHDGRTQVRCFDAGWWKAAAKKRAAARKAKEEKRAREAAEGEPDAPVEIEWPDQSVPIKSRDLVALGLPSYGHPEFDFEWRVPDAGLLPPEHLYWRLGYDGTPLLLCLDKTAGEAAAESGEEALERRIHEAWARRGEEDREAVSAGGKVIADLWVDGLGTAVANPLRLAAALEELTGTPLPRRGSAVAWAREHADPRALEVALMVLGLRLGRGEINEHGQDLLTARVRTEYGEEQRQALREAGLPDPVMPEEEADG